MLFIGLGYFLNQRKFFVDSEWQTLEKLIYYILFPALVIHALATANFQELSFLKVAIALNVAQLMMFLVSFAAWLMPAMTGPQFTSIVQNNIRWNSYVALAITTSLYPNYVVVVVLAIACMVPTSNILSVWCLLIWGKPATPQQSNPVTELLMNPLIISCFIGLLLQSQKITLPIFLEPTMDMLGKTAMPLGLMSIGAGLNFTQTHYLRRDNLLWVLVRLLGLPLVTFFTCRLFGVYDPIVILVTLIVAASPTATTSYILARKMGGDTAMMANIIGASSLLSLLTIPLIISVYTLWQ